MPLSFKLFNHKTYGHLSTDVIYLHPDNWDDFGYKTLFLLEIRDKNGNGYKIGNVKIGFSGQQNGWTKDFLDNDFNLLPEKFYSLGQDADYYKNLVDNFPNDFIHDLLTSLGDIAFIPKRLETAKTDDVFTASLLRSISISTIESQFQRILRRESPLTEYHFRYEKPSSDRYSGFSIDFHVDPNQKPTTNIHVLIGRNGVGKTTLLNDMVDALIPGRSYENVTGNFSHTTFWGLSSKLSNGYFSGLVSVSFSAFDPFTPPKDQRDQNLGLKYYYVGLKQSCLDKNQARLRLKDKYDLRDDFITSLGLCLTLSAKKERWGQAVNKLESDHNFAEMDLLQLIQVFNEDSSTEKSKFSQAAGFIFERMSSGHAIVILTITKLIETVEEKTLVLLDEPESHLHPPLLSAFTRALSELLNNRNGVAIIATHSPVILQEVPKTCVSILRRTRLIASVNKPENETFAENVGVLTREVFGLEVSKSGYHELLSKSVLQGKTYEDIEEEYQHQLGFEGKAILRSMIMNRDLNLGNKE
ncbi:AAA family ATPase [Citrobacter freundii]|nr:AAA family ATPase [Citrobacter freundii]DAY69492.1 MAG TPA: AAA domain protein [Caudoviricetes sp.]